MEIEIVKSIPAKAGLGARPPDKAVNLAPPTPGHPGLVSPGLVSPGPPWSGQPWSALVPPGQLKVLHSNSTLQSISNCWLDGDDQRDDGGGDDNDDGEGTVTIIMSSKFNN